MIMRQRAPLLDTGTSYKTFLVATADMDKLDMDKLENPSQAHIEKLNKIPSLIMTACLLLTVIISANEYRRLRGVG